jgi:hypothetical protein
MRKVLTSLLAMLLIAGLSVSPSFAVSLQGKNCSKIGQVKNSSGLKYVCVQINGKSIWNKAKNNSTSSGSKVASNNSGPKPGDLPPRNLENCGEGVYFYRMNNGVLERAFYENGPYVSKDPRPNSSFDPIRVKAYEIIRSHVAKSPAQPVQTFYTSEEFPRDVLAVLKDQLNNSVKYWSDYFPSNSEVHATFTTLKNSKILFNDNMLRPTDAMWIFDTYSKSDYAKCGGRSGISGSHIMYDGKNAGEIGYWIIYPDAHNVTHWFPTYLTHEFVHGVQGLFWFGRNVEPLNVAYNHIEGGAELFGNALALPNIGWYQDAVNKKMVNQYTYNPKDQPIPNNEADVLNMLKLSEKGEQNKNSGFGSGVLWAYTVGLHLWEWVLANYGFEAYWDILRNFANNMTYDEAVQKSVGISKDALYREASPYILRQFQRVFKK